MRRDSGGGLLSALVAAGAGLVALAHAPLAYADMGFSPGFLRDSVGVDQYLFVVMLCAALVSAAVGVFGLWRMSRSGPYVRTPRASETGPLDE
jgi:hypothetical protein